MNSYRQRRERQRRQEQPISSLHPSLNLNGSSMLADNQMCFPEWKLTYLYMYVPHGFEIPRFQLRTQLEKTLCPNPFSSSSALLNKLRFTFLEELFKNSTKLHST